MSDPEEVPVVGLMQACFIGGMEQVAPGRHRVIDDAADWEQWWAEHGKALLDRHYAGVTLFDLDGTVADIHRLVQANNAGIAHMLEAMQPFEPDETLPGGGDLWTLTAMGVHGEELHYTVTAPGLKAASEAAAKAWGHGAWETLRKRRAQVED